MYVYDKNQLCQQTIKVHQGCNYGSATSMRISKLITKKQSRKPQFVYLLIKREYDDTELKKHIYINEKKILFDYFENENGLQMVLKVLTRM